MAPGNIQEHSLLPDYLGLSPAEFWERVGREKQEHDADQILVYLRLLLEVARERGLPITRAVLQKYGASTRLFEGVQTWFSRMNAFAKARGLALEHYIVSSANQEMIDGTEVASEFTRVFASRYIYDDSGCAVWPAAAVNYTTKTQYLFRINKGVQNTWDNEPVNRWLPMNERPLPFQRMLYLGDGETDIPSMKMVRHQGGHSVAVFDPEKWDSTDPQTSVHTKQTAYRLIAEDRAHFVVPADYCEGSQLEITVQGVLGRIARDEGWRSS